MSRNRVGGELKTIRNTNKAQGNIAGFFITMMLATIVALAVAWPAIDQAINGNVGYATNSYNFTGNTTTGEYINISTGLGSYSKSCFYVNTSGAGKPVGCLVLNTNGGNNTSAMSASILRTALAADTDINGIISVTNTSTTNAIVTLTQSGSEYNWAASDTVTNGGWNAAAFSGGSYGATQNMSASSLILVGLIPLFLVLSLLLLFIRPLI